MVTFSLTEQKPGLMTPIDATSEVVSPVIPPVVTKEPNQVDASTLSQPVIPVKVPQPKISTNDGSQTQNLINNVATNTQGFIQAQSEEAKRAQELAGLLGNQNFDGAGQREEYNQQFNQTANLSRLQDIQTQLAKANTESNITQSRIAASAGQTLSQGGREITQEQRESAIRNAGLAAEASVLQGNIETASTLINQAMSDYYSDRQLNNQNMIQQLDYFSGIADKQTSQLLQKEQRQYEEDQQNIKDVKDAVSSALATGSATGKQISLLTDPNSSDTDRLRVAQEIIAQSSAEDRNLKLAQIRQSIAASSLSAKKNRLALCESGDSASCGEFNIDPEAMTEEEVQERINNQNQSIELEKNIERLQGVMDNDMGLQLSSGASQSPLLAGGLGGPLAGTQQGNAADMLGFVPVVGNVMNYNRAKESKEQFLGDIQYLLSNRIFEKVAEIKSDGYAGAISDTELGLMANASSVLNSLAIRDGDTLIGFRGGEENLSNELGVYMDIYKRANDALNTKALGTSMKTDIINAYNE